MTSFEGKKVAILGWGINGLDVAKYLVTKGSKLTIFDAKEKKDLDLSGFETGKAKLIAGEEYLKKGLDVFDYIFRAPGVYPYLPELSEAQKRGAEVSSVVKLFFDLCPGKIVGVTGTKGKGTTS